MIGYDWPGNIRELKNVIEATIAIENDSLVGLDGLSRLMDIERFRKTKKSRKSIEQFGDALGVFEQVYFQELLEYTGDNVEKAAAKAGINIATLYRKIKKYRLR